ncbi:MAG: TonB-dependent receptor plug domain-containing protein, partial [Ignavibacteriales bacterium]
MIHRLLLAGASALAIATAAPAFAEDATHTFDIPAQPLSSALLAYSHQTDTPVIASMDLLAGKTAPAVKGDMAEGQALAMLLQGTGLKAERGPTGSIVVERIAADPQSGSAAGDGADAGTVAALVVTAQKREENIQDVPIAISAFTQKSLEEQKIEGGFDLLKAIPNVTFSKNNFSSYNFSIRGIGTKAVSVTTDPGVAVAFNNTALIRNRLFEQEYFDVERVEVLRGPQGTLYGRNATAGVINVISAKPNLQDFSGWLKGEVGNYHTKRVSAMVNVPLVEDKLAIRFAGALTDRAGYDYNSVTKHHINGRDLWSARVTVG